MGFKTQKWTLEEKKKLLEIYKTETDWQGRSAKMYHSFPARKMRGFFSPNACQAQFDELMASPCPGQKPAASGRASYSLKAVVDMWIEHLRGEISKEYDRQNELYMVEMRNCYALVDRLLSGKPEMSEEQLTSLLEEAREHDAKSGREDVELVTNIYMHTLMDAFKMGTPKPGGQELPPTKRSEELPRGVETAFRSPSPSRSPPKSPLKSPIRPVAETMRDGLSPQAIKSIEVRREELRRTLSPVKKAVKEAEKATTPSVKNTPVREKDEPMEMDNNNDTSVETAAKIDDVESTPIVAPKKRGRKSKASSNSTKVNTPRREETASPTPESSSSKRSRLTRKSGVSGAEPPEKKEKPEPSSTTPSLAGDVTPSLPIDDDKFYTCAAQTDITIICAAPSAEKEKKDRRQPAARKSSARKSEAEKTDAEVSADGERRDVGIQCQRLEFDRDDKVLVTWFDTEKAFVPTVDVKKEVMEFDEARHETPAVDDEPEDRRSSKSDLKRELAVIYDTEEWVARSLLQQPNFSIETESGGTSKRPVPRKDDRSREENIQIKSLLMNTWRAVFSHRHSGIFAHPVSDRDAPGYQNVVKQRMDLQTLKREVENGVVTTPEQMKHRLMRMFANAVMFNSSGHDVNTYAKEMARDTMAELSRLIQEGLKGPMSNHHPRRTKMPEEHSSRPSRPEQRTRFSVGQKRPVPNEFTSGTRKVFRRKTLPDQKRKVRV